jgi:phage head maturation protease
MVLGRTRSGTLRLSEDSAGLHYEVDTPDTSYARDLAVSMERGDITQSSFAFRTRADDWGFTEQDVPLRTLRDVMLLDVSPVAYPAYLDATSGLGHRALERLAEARGLTLADVRADVSAALRTHTPASRPDTPDMPTHREDDTDLIRLSALARLL